MNMKFSSLAPDFGLCVDGLDISHSLSEEQKQALRDAWSRSNGVMLFRNQHMTPEQHVNFSSIFGEVYIKGAVNNVALAPYYLPGHPAIFRVSNKVVDGKPAGREDAGTYWHSDASWQAIPPRGSLLYAVEIPPVGGDTMFADMYRAYENLSNPFKKLLEGLEAEHSLAAAVLRTSYAKEYVGRLDEAAAKKAVHPVVLTHPQSGRKCLFVNPGFTSHIIGIPSDESKAILDFLYQHAVKSENVYRHRWQKNDLIIWDNRCNLHYAVADYKKEGVRYMHRTTVKNPT